MVQTRVNANRLVNMATIDITFQQQINIPHITTLNTKQFVYASENHMRSAFFHYTGIAYDNL